MFEENSGDGVPPHRLTISLEGEYDGRMHARVGEPVNVDDNIFEEDGRSESELVIDDGSNFGIMYIQFNASVPILQILNVSPSFSFTCELIPNQITIMRA